LNSLAEDKHRFAGATEDMMSDVETDPEDPEENTLSERKPSTSSAALPRTSDCAIDHRQSPEKFLGVHIIKELTWSSHTQTFMKRAQQHLLLRRLKRFGMGPQIFKVLQLRQ
jgi:hypothetical protein